MKKLGRQSLKKHYVIFVAACLIAAFLGSEFVSSLDFSNAQDYEQTIYQIESDLNDEGAYSVKTTVGAVSWANILRTIAENDTEAGREMAEQTEAEEIRSAEEGNPVFGRTRGVFSSMVNQLSSGSIIVTLVAAIASITGSENLGVLILIALGALGVTAFWFLVINMF